MPLHLERVDWMPSPPLAPDDGPIDTDHLQRMTLGDASLEREVLAMFSAQAASLIGALAALPPEAGALAHTLKGSARAIGAFRVAEAAESLEAAIQGGDDPAFPRAVAEFHTQAQGLAFDDAAQPPSPGDGHVARGGETFRGEVAGRKRVAGPEDGRHAVGADGLGGYLGA